MQFSTTTLTLFLTALLASLSTTQARIGQTPFTDNRMMVEEATLSHPDREPLGSYSVYMVTQEGSGLSVGLLDENNQQTSQVDVAGDDITCVKVGDDVIPQADEASGELDKVSFYTHEWNGGYVTGSINCETAGKANFSKCYLSQSSFFPRNACVIVA